MSTAGWLAAPTRRNSPMHVHVHVQLDYCGTLASIEDSTAVHLAPWFFPELSYRALCLCLCDVRQWKLKVRLRLSQS
jgi:hypothetical protein